MEIALTLSLSFLSAHRVGDVSKETCEQFAKPFEVGNLKCLDRFTCPIPRVAFRLQVVVGYERHKPFAHFIIGKVEKEGVECEVAILNREIPTLINHGQRLFNVSLIVDKFAGVVIAPREFVQILVRMVEQIYEVSRCARAEPVVVNTL